MPSTGGPQVMENTGEATYTYAFALPKARGRYQPTLALTYGSGCERNVGYGQGWSLTESYVEHDAALGTDFYRLTIDGATMALEQTGTSVALYQAHASRTASSGSSASSRVVGFTLVWLASILGRVGENSVG